MSDEPDDELHSAADPAPDDAVGQKRRESKESRIRREAAEAERFWRAVYGSTVGRREMWRLIANPDGAHAFETRFPVGPSGVPDPNAAWYEKGVQDFGLRLYHAHLKLDPANVAVMHQENDVRFSQPKRRKASE